MKKHLTFVTAVVAVMATALFSGLATAQTTITTQGKSTFTLVVPTDAPTSVQDAAQELQKCVEISTGAKLPISNDENDIPSSKNVISIGNTKYAKSAGVTSDDMKDDSYRIITKNNNLYLIGIDTPDGKWNDVGGVSRGTANAAYVFLEDYLGVRWLMPGDIGRDVPRKSTFTIDEINRTETPPFSYRYLYSQVHHANQSQREAITSWSTRQRVGDSYVQPVGLQSGHNWWAFINEMIGGNKATAVNTDAVKQLYKEHPDWFAMDASGKRPLPKTIAGKLETTNQELVKWFADQTIKKMKSSDRNMTLSLSPSDGVGWSQSSESKALYDPPIPNANDPEAEGGSAGMSSLVLKWYHDIAQIVQKEYPQGRLAGYIYAHYLYPPTKFEMKLPDNFTPVIAPGFTAGFSLYRPETMKTYETVMSQWAKVAPDTWYYYGLPIDMMDQMSVEVGGRKGNFPGSVGIITPAAPDILNDVSRVWKENHIKGTILYGIPSWSNAAMANYMLAKKEWDPNLDAHKLQREWLTRAYGTGAGKVMEQFYDNLDAWYRDYYQANPDASYHLTLDILQKIYAAHYPEMEKVLLQAKQQQMSPIHKERFQLIENNLIVLQWRLRNAGFLPSSLISPLKRNDKQINDLLTEVNNDFPLFAGVMGEPAGNWVKPKPFPWDVKINNSGSDIAKSTFSGMQDDSFLIHANQSGNIQIVPKMVTQGAYFATYQIKNQQSEVIKSGLLSADLPIIIPAKAGDSFYISIPSRQPVNYELVVQNANVANGSFDAKSKTLTLSGDNASNYVYMPLSDTLTGVFQSGDDVVLRKPFSGRAAELSFQQTFANVKIVDSFDQNWLFATDPQNDGLQRGVEKPDFDDSSWKPITALNWWQFQGYPDYLGTAWYRITFDLEDNDPKARASYLYFGAVDGNATVYLNGKKVTEHLLVAPDYKGWNLPFSANVTYILKPGKNTIAVKVTSKPVGSSGMFKGVTLLTTDHGRKKSK